MRTNGKPPNMIHILNVDTPHIRETKRELDMSENENLFSMPSRDKESIRNVNP